MSFVNAAAWLRDHDKPARFSVPDYRRDGWLTGRDAARELAARAWYAPMRLGYQGARELGLPLPEGEVGRWRTLLRACWAREDES